MIKAQLMLRNAGCEDNQGQKIIKAQLVLRRSKDDQGGRWDQDDSIYD